LNQHGFFETLALLLNESDDIAIVRASLSIITHVTSSFDFDSELTRKIFPLFSILSAGRFDCESILHSILCILVNFFSEGIYSPEEYGIELLKQIFERFFVCGTFRQKRMVFKIVHNLAAFLNELALRDIFDVGFLREYFDVFVGLDLREDSVFLDSAIVLARLAAEDLEFDFSRLVEYLDGYEMENAEVAWKLYILRKVAHREIDDGTFEIV
jgi:hypothetical protein